MTHNLSPMTFVALLAFCSFARAQDITVSKDSILVYNNLIMSSMDGVVFTSHSSVPVHLDSAYVTITESDISPLSKKFGEMSWRSTTSGAQQFVWTMDSIAPKTFRLNKKDYEPPASEPLVFSGTGQTGQISFLEIGYCFICVLATR